MLNPMLPDRKQFAADPAGYSRSAWMRWAMLAAAHGSEVDPMASPSSHDLKSPILWLAQAEAMSQAATTLARIEPTFETVPVPMRGICDTQYCAVALMLVGYSLELCLKAVLIHRLGIEAYSEAEKARKHQHHKLHDLAEVLPGLSAKDLAILELLTHFVYWAGRYPDPGQSGIPKHEQVFELSEQYQVSAHDLFQVAGRVMKQVGALISAEA